MPGLIFKKEKNEKRKKTKKTLAGSFSLLTYLGIIKEYGFLCDGR
jgi:hypothetical protein